MTELPFKMKVRLYQGATFTRKIVWVDSANVPVLDLSLYNARLVIKGTDGRRWDLNSATSPSLVLDAVEGSVLITLSTGITGAMKSKTEAIKYGDYALTLVPKSGNLPTHALLYGEVFAVPGNL